jgi:hypothetical protein
MAELVTLGHEIVIVLRIRSHFDRHSLDHVDAVAFQAHAFGGIVGQQPDPLQAEV